MRRLTYTLAVLSLAVAVRPVAAQPALFADLVPGPESSDPHAFTVADDALYFLTSTDGETTRWRYDGSAFEVLPSLPLPGDRQHSGSVIRHDGWQYFVTLEHHPDNTAWRALWAHNDASGSTVLVADSVRGTQPFVFGGQLLYQNGTTAGDSGLWTYDPTTGTSSLVVSGEAAQWGTEFTALDGRLYYYHPFGDDGIWQYDPATGEATLVATTNPDGRSNIVGLTPYADRLYFSAFSPGSGNELWSYEPATGTTSKVAELHEGMWGSDPRDFTVYDRRLFFLASSESIERELWMYDAATGEAQRIAEFWNSFSLSFGGMTVYDGRLFFGSDREELWRYDATTETLEQLGETAALPELTVFDGRLLFRGTDDTHGTELWAYASAATSAEPAAASDLPLLSPIFPNPTRDSAIVALSLDRPQSVRLAVYDALGREVAVLHEGALSATDHRFHLDGSALPSGLYVIRVVGTGFVATQRVTVVR